MLSVFICNNCLMVTIKLGNALQTVTLGKLVIFFPVLAACQIVCSFIFIIIILYPFFSSSSSERNNLTAVLGEGLMNSASICQNCDLRGELHLRMALRQHPNTGNSLRSCCKSALMQRASSPWC